jgi:hypothetical protein
MAWDRIPDVIVDECAQLTKANSIEGNANERGVPLPTPNLILLFAAQAANWEAFL